MIYGITYADDKMQRSADACIDSMEKHGVGNIVFWDELDIDLYFKSFNDQIFSQQRGAGCYWIFKPYIIESQMRMIDDGDILVYSDAGVEFVNSVHHIIDRMDEDIFFFSNGHKHVEWCKGDVLEAMLPVNNGKPIRMDRIFLSAYYTQVQASVIFFKVNQNTRNFVKEWLLWCQMPGFIDDSPSKLPNYPTFADHRHDQAILTCLQIKYGYKLHFWPTNYSEHIRHTAQPGDDYPTLFNHHRRRDKGHGEGVNPEWE